MEEQSQNPDYDLAEVMEATTPEQFRAYGDPTRQRIMSLLSERAATTKQLAGTLGKPVGGIGHHLKVLLEAGFVRVVRTRQVRAITEKYYGRVARRTDFSPEHFAPSSSWDGGLPPYFPLRQAIDEFDRGQPYGELLPAFVLQHARVPASRAEELAGRMIELAEEFKHEVNPGEKVYGLVAGVYLTDLPEMPEEE